MRDHNRLRNKEESDREEPQHYMRRTRFDGGSEKIRNDDKQDRSENEVGEAELFTKGRAVGLFG